MSGGADGATVAVAGAGGQLGRRVAELLLARAQPPARLVLATRDPDALAELRGARVELRRSDADDAASLADAFAGVDRLLIVSAPGHDNDERLRRHRATIDAAARAGVQHAIYTSSVRATEQTPSLLAISHLETERLLAASGMRWTILRNALYAEYLCGRLAGALAAGEYVSNAGDGRVAWVAREDCAAVAAAVLADGAPHAAATYDVTGPELLSDEDALAVLARVSGRALPRRRIDDDAAAALLRDAGLAPDAAEVYASFLAGVRGGTFAVRSDTVERLAGRAPLPLADVLSEVLAAAR